MISPTLDQFRALAREGNLIPVTRQFLADFETPLSAYRKIRGQGESFLFESVEGGEHLGRYSFVGVQPSGGHQTDRPARGARERSRRRTISGRSVTPAPTTQRTVRDGLALVERVLGRFRPVPVPGPAPFTGGAVGFLAYEFIHDIEPVVPHPARDDLGTPVLYFLVTDELLVFDRGSTRRSPCW
jgi:anthranilate synthase component I